MPVASMKASDVDVLIVGAGPAGLMCANALAKAGVKVRIIDKRPVKVIAGQADGIQPRTIEVLQSYGLAERLLKEANQMHTLAFYNPGPNGGIVRTSRVRDVSSCGARYPFEATLHQGAIEDIILDSMLEYGLTVDRPVFPTSLEFSKDEAVLKDPKSHAVKVVLSRLDHSGREVDTESVHAKYVIGADGAHSWVRKSLGIAMEGEQTEHLWGVVDLTPDTDFPDVRNRSAIHSHNGSCMIIPREGDKIRIYIQLSNQDIIDSSTGRVDRSKIGPEELLEVARKSLFPYKLGTPNSFDWWTIYSIGQRVASQFSMHDRVFIVGDACHTHSPKAGQGMNASMNDSHNLAWKIVHVLRAWANPSLLRTYEFERRKYAQDLIDFDREFSALFSGKPRTEENQDGVSQEEFQKAFQIFGDFTSGIGIHYAQSAIVNAKHQHLAPGLVIGQRTPPQILLRAADARPYELQDLLPADGRFKILIFSGDYKSTPLANLRQLADNLSHKDCFLAGKNSSKMFDVLTILSGGKEEVDYTDVPENLRSHWSKVFVDDIDMSGTKGGQAYATFGINPSCPGTVVVVRPDGYVGFISHLDAASDINGYFQSFIVNNP